MHNEQALIKALKYMNEDARRATYKRKWVFKEDAPCNANKMAEAGFIYTGTKNEPDSVICFFCHKSLDGWEKDDNPWEEHLKHSKGCDFAKIQMPQRTLTLQEYVNLTGSLISRALDKKMEEDVKLIEEKYDKVEKLLTRKL